MPLGIENLEVSERGIDDVNVTVVVDADTLGARELPALPPNRTETAQELAVPTEYLHAEVTAVDDI